MVPNQEDFLVGLGAKWWNIGRQDGERFFIFTSALMLHPILPVFISIDLQIMLVCMQDGLFVFFSKMRYNCSGSFLWILLAPHLC